nr:uncharacterized protein LOC128700266 [Cherax quadricarinatus]
MTQLTSLILTLMVLVIGAGAQSELHYPQGFPLEQCLSQRMKDALKEKFCGDLGLTDADCIAQESGLRKCKVIITQGAQGPAIINASADCFQSVTGINVPAAARGHHKALAAVVEAAIQTNRKSVCDRTLQLLYCLSTNTNVNQLMSNCLAGSNK